MKGKDKLLFSHRTYDANMPNCAKQIFNVCFSKGFLNSGTVCCSINDAISRAFPAFAKLPETAETSKAFIGYSLGSQPNGKYNINIWLNIDDKITEKKKITVIASVHLCKNI